MSQKKKEKGIGGSKGFKPKMSVHVHQPTQVGVIWENFPGECDIRIFLLRNPVNEQIVAFESENVELKRKAWSNSETKSP